MNTKTVKEKVEDIIIDECWPVLDIGTSTPREAGAIINIMTTKIDKLYRKEILKKLKKESIGRPFGANKHTPFVLVSTIEEILLHNKL